ncbi:hypothetical protein CDAR_450011 [Caerostris darwini]|uniref:Uncharacterized protein n=1 Tax=Caerostris darwini TaxID=1538125 RepID=A0AAV4QS63_9ARAC|nr:hypothetical protein CDAR_450011 [Caerostris darwini]
MHPSAFDNSDELESQQEPKEKHRKGLIVSFDVQRCLHKEPDDVYMKLDYKLDIQLLMFVDLSHHIERMMQSKTPTFVLDIIITEGQSGDHAADVMNKPFRGNVTPVLLIGLWCGVTSCMVGGPSRFLFGYSVRCYMDFITDAAVRQFPEDILAIFQ